MKNVYETIKYDENLPAKIRLRDGQAWKYITESHWHREIELIYMLDGELKVTKGGSLQTLQSGDVILINSGEIHKLESENSDDKLSFLSVHLSVEFAKRFYDTIDSAYFVIEKGSRAEDEIRSLMLRLAQSGEDSDEFVSLTRYTVLTEIYHTLFTKCRRKRQISMYGNCRVSFRNAKIAIEYIAEHYSENISLNDIASLVGLNPVYFSKYFKDVTDTSFVTYLNQVRLEHAIDDMVSRDLSVADAAQCNGFANVKSFTEVCKRSYGLTPLQFKKQQLRVS